MILFLLRVTKDRNRGIVVGFRCGVCGGGDGTSNGPLAVMGL